MRIDLAQLGQSVQRLDIGDKIIDLRAAQREIRHLTMRVYEETAQLLGAHTAGGNRRQ